MNNLILLKKAWSDKDGKYGEKDYWLNPAVAIKGVEGCKVWNEREKVEVNCVKVYYPDAPYLVFVGTPEQFFAKCREAVVAFCLLQDLYKEGLTIRQFIKINERVNGVQLSQ